MSQNKIIIVLLGASLLFNVYTVSKINELRGLVAHDIQYYSERIYGEELDEIRDIIDEIKQENQWISDVDIQYVGNTGDKQSVRFSWQLKDYAPGSDVSFFYRKSGEEEFKQIPAESRTDGNFVAELELEREAQPEWMISQEYEKKEGGASEVVSVKNLTSHEYEYYITMNDGSRILSSEVESAGLGKIVQEYAPMEVDLYLGKDNRPSYVDLYWDGGKTEPSKIVLEIYDKNKLVESEPKPDPDEKHTLHWKSGDTDFDKLVVKVTYENGKEFEKEIWNENV